jgi:hypothetical protein
MWRIYGDFPFAGHNIAQVASETFVFGIMAIAPLVRLRIRLEVLVGGYSRPWKAECGRFDDLSALGMVLQTHSPYDAQDRHLAQAQTW